MTADIKIKLDAVPGHNIADAFKDLMATVGRVSDAMFQQGLRDIAKRTTASVEDLQQVARDIRSCNQELTDQDVLRILQQMCFCPKPDPAMVRDLAVQMAKVAAAGDVHIPEPSYCGQPIPYRDLAKHITGERWSHYSPARYPKPDDVVRWTWRGAKFRGRVTGLRLEKSMHRPQQVTVDVTEDRALVVGSTGGRWTFGDPDDHNDLATLEYMEETMSKPEQQPNQWRKYNGTSSKPCVGDRVRAVVHGGVMVEGKIIMVHEFGNIEAELLKPSAYGKLWTMSATFARDEAEYCYGSMPRPLWSKYAGKRLPKKDDRVRIFDGSRGETFSAAISVDWRKDPGPDSLGWCQGTRDRDGMEFALSGQKGLDLLEVYDGCGVSGCTIVHPQAYEQAGMVHSGPMMNHLPAVILDPPYDARVPTRIGYALSAAAAGRPVQVALDTGAGIFTAARAIKIGETITAACVENQPAQPKTPTTRPAEPMRPEHKCALGWCAATTRAAFCSTNCEHTASKHGEIHHRLSDFEARIKTRGDADSKVGNVGYGGTAYRNTDGARTIDGELAWAKEKTAQEIQALKHSWYALRHKTTEGNENVWPVCDDGED